MRMLTGWQEASEKIYVIHTWADKQISDACACVAGGKSRNTQIATICLDLL